jgi:hypothetical protein
MPCPSHLPWLDHSIFSCCSHLQHRASVKRLVSLQFLNLRKLVGPLGWGISLSQGCYLHRTTQTHEKRRQTYMPWVGFEPTIPVFQQVKTFDALHCSAAVNSSLPFTLFTFLGLNISVEICALFTHCQSLPNFFHHLISGQYHSQNKLTRHQIQIYLGENLFWYSTYRKLSVNCD